MSSQMMRRFATSSLLPLSSLLLSMLHEMKKKALPELMPLTSLARELLWVRPRNTDYHEQRKY